MIIDLIKNKESLIQAWKDVLDDQSDANWALFGYEGQTNSLKVIGQGSQGIEELVEDLNSGKIMYAFVKVNDPKTSLPKFVLINWQGEGANTVRKGICANHLRDVENFFTGAHLTITARNEEEVEPDLIINRISKSGSTYSFNVPRSDTSGIKASVGSNYQRINPVKEINASERDQFWLKEEEEENKRQADERKRKEIMHQETFPKKKEYVEIDKGNANVEKIANEVVPTKEFEIIKLHDEKGHCSDASIDNIKKVNQSELLRQQRKKEAQDLIAQRTFDARSIFENSTSTGQLKYTPQKPIRSSLFKAQLPQNVYSTQPNLVDSKCNLEESDQSQTKIFEEQLSDDDSDQFSTIKRSPRDPEKKSEFISLSTSEEHGKMSSNICNDKYVTSNHLQHITDQQFVDEVIYQEFNDGPGLQAKALYDYEAADDTEITFDPGDVITNIDQVDEGWWQGLGPDGTYGLFPANYVELIE